MLILYRCKLVRKISCWNLCIENIPVVGNLKHKNLSKMVDVLLTFYYCASIVWSRAFAVSHLKMPIVLSSVFTHIVCHVHGDSLARWVYQSQCAVKDLAAI